MVRQKEMYSILGSNKKIDVGISTTPKRRAQFFRAHLFSNLHSIKFSRLDAPILNKD